MESFSVEYRNYGHWDIYNNRERIYRIRGGPGAYRVINEIDRNAATLPFKTVAACMAYICDILMYELIIAEGQKPQVIESWNI